MKFWIKELCFTVLLWSNWCIFEEIPIDVFKDGHPVAHKHFPFIVSLQEWEVRWQHICVGNVVDQKNILTACQCVGRVGNNSVERKDVKKLRVYAGAGDLDCGSAAEQYIMVTDITPHPRVSSGANGLVEFDLAVLHLAHDLEFNAEISPMNLPKVDPAFHSKAVCHSPGWGSPCNQRNPSKNLTLVRYRRIPRPQCYHFFCRLFLMCSTNFRKQEQTCASNYKFTSCFTELGSPLVCHGFIYGMATFRDGPNSPVVFTGLNPILDMIHGIAENERERARRVLENKKRLEAWVRMLSSSSPYHQATPVTVALECLLARTLR